jgi:hypothetical protein
LFPCDPVVYNVASTQQSCIHKFTGVFCQPNGVVSCSSGLAGQAQDPHIVVSLAVVTVTCIRSGSLTVQRRQTLVRKLVSVVMVCKRKRELQ